MTPDLVREPGHTSHTGGEPHTREDVEVNCVTLMRSWCPAVCSNISLDVALRVIWRRASHVNRRPQSQADHPPWGGWASSDQSKALRDKAEVPPSPTQGGRNSAFTRQTFQPAGLLACGFLTFQSPQPPL